LNLKALRYTHKEKSVAALSVRLSTKLAQSRPHALRVFIPLSGNMKIVKHKGDITRKKGMMQLSDPVQEPITHRLIEMWRSAIVETEDHQIDLESAQKFIDETREILRASGATPENERYFLRALKLFLPALTGCHPICRQFIPLLEIELEF
jgi:hypothetical protein